MYGAQYHAIKIARTGDMPLSRLESNGNLIYAAQQVRVHRGHPKKKTIKYTVTQLYFLRKRQGIPET